MAAAVRMNIQMLLEAADYLERREREAEHGYASMLPYNNKDRDALKRRNKSKKNNSSSEIDVDVESTDYLTGDLDWSSSSVSDSDERGSMQSLGSDEGYSSASIKRIKLQDSHKACLGL
uniref:MAX dimerization protein 1 n=1 Tax=Macaca nemestrina TaxID=9545 RepID=A0A2K6CDG1_MACNE